MISESFKNLIDLIDNFYLVEETYNIIMIAKNSKISAIIFVVSGIYAIINAIIYIKYQMINIEYKAVKTKNIQAKKSEQIKSKIDKKRDLVFKDPSEQTIIDYLNEVENLSTCILSGVINCNKSIELYKDLFISLEKTENLRNCIYEVGVFEETKKIIKILKRRMIIRKILFLNFGVFKKAKTIIKILKRRMIMKKSSSSNKELK